MIILEEIILEVITQREISNSGSMKRKYSLYKSLSDFETENRIIERKTKYQYLPTTSL